MTIYCNDTLVCKNLRYMRRKRRLTMRALSRLTGIDSDLIRMLENAKVPPAVDYVPFKKVCDALNVSVEDMIHTNLAGDS